jgi:hypothetical protein
VAITAATSLVMIVTTTAGATPAPNDSSDPSTTHDSRIVESPAPRFGYSWGHDSTRVEQPAPVADFATDHDSRIVEPPEAQR